jgi:hypothetical protein
VHAEPTIRPALCLFLVERRLPSVNRRSLAMLQAALVQACDRFAERGHHIRHVRSTFLPGQGRLLSAFEGESLELVIAVNNVSLAPFLSIEPAFELSVLNEESGAV